MKKKIVGSSVFGRQLDGTPLVVHFISRFVFVSEKYAETCVLRQAMAARAPADPAVPLPLCYVSHRARSIQPPPHRLAGSRALFPATLLPRIKRGGATDPLKPSQPTHSSAAPSTDINMLCGWKFSRPKLVL